MGRILSGLVQTGAWGCFDEFNRLDEATLSTISMYIQQIQNALHKQISKIILLDKEIQVNKYCGIFVTLNPAGGNYGGRNKLPDNLKQLFRPIIMTHPDHEQITRTLLYCDGYKNADAIGKKLIEVFTSSSKLLSNQQHYDWGLRAIKTVVNSCSHSIKRYQELRPNESLSLEKEMSLVMDALKMDTLSKLTYNDSKKFYGILEDTFPGIDNHQNNDIKLKEALENSCLELGLKINEKQVVSKQYK